MKKYILSLLLMCGLGLAMVACDEGPTPTDAKVAAQQAASLQQASSQVGMPGITNFTEMKLVRKLYELRDQNITTYSYVPDMQGHLHFICPSFGFGLPYGVQFSNPQVPYNRGGAQYGFALPQAEPNGLFMPDTAEGTWVICQDPNKKGDIAPIYVEPRVIVSPFKLNAVDDWQAK